MSSSEGDAPTATAALQATVPSGDAQPVSLDRAMLGRYRLERVLGVGGMGVVHAAVDLDLERRVAIKVLHGDPAHGSRARLLREARAMARLDHPNVVKIYEVDSIDGIDFVVMELVSGSSLAEWLRSEPRAPRDIVAAFVAAGNGLAAAHATGMVHRDFKPHNVMRSRAGAIKVGDFGLARDADDGAAASDAQPADASATALTPSKLANVTQTGAMVGTPAYMAPEQWHAGTISPAADQFAFCVALWEALAGERPFRGETIPELRAAIEAGPTAESLAKLPRRHRTLLVRGLAADPARRWPSMRAIVDALQPGTSRRRVWIGGALAAAVALALALAFGGSSPSGPAEPRVFMPKPRAALVATVEKLGEDHYRLPRDTVSQVLLDRTELTEAIKAVPTTAGDDVVGFKLFAVRPSSLAAKLGLRNFDRVTGLDELAFETEANVIAAYHRVATAPRVGLHYVRAQQRHTVVIEISP